MSEQHEIGATAFSTQFFVCISLRYLFGTIQERQFRPWWISISMAIIFLYAFFFNFFFFMIFLFSWFAFAHLWHINFFTWLFVLSHVDDFPSTRCDYSRQYFFMGTQKHAPATFIKRLDIYSLNELIFVMCRVRRCVPGCSFLSFSYGFEF